MVSLSTGVRTMFNTLHQKAMQGAAAAREQRRYNVVGVGGASRIEPSRGTARPARTALYYYPLGISPSFQSGGGTLLA